MLGVIIVGGHFGSGKTTLLLRGLERLKRDGLKTGVLINDLGPVDFKLVASKADCLVESVSRHCLCVKGHDLKEALKRLIESEVDIILAEAIGFSDPYRVWTTISNNLSALNYSFKLNPITVLVDGEFLIKLHKGSNLIVPSMIADQLTHWVAPEYAAEAINDMLLQQLSEADVIVINKCDLMPSTSQIIAEELIREINAEAKVHLISATTNYGVDHLFSDLMNMKWSSRPPKAKLEFDKRRMEALSGMQWFTYEVEIESQNKTVVQNFIKDVLTRSLNEIPKKFKGKGQIIRVKAHFGSQSNSIYASLTPNLNIDLHSYGEKPEVKNGKFTISFVVKNIMEEDVIATLTAALSKISHRFAISKA